MKTWLESLPDQIAQSRTPRTDDAEASRLEKSAMKERRSLGIDERVRRVVASLPDDLRGQPLRLDYFRARLGAKWAAGRRAHAGEIGGALLKLGWTRRRVWRSDQFEGRYPSVWHPPVTQDTDLTKP